MTGRASTARKTNLRLLAEEESVHVGTVADWAKDLSDKFLHCRELGHLWRPHTAGRHPDGGFTRTLRCSRCYTRRHQELSHTGMPLSNQYEYAEGYLTENIGRITGEARGALRLESIYRVLPEGEE